MKQTSLFAAIVVVVFTCCLLLCNCDPSSLPITEEEAKLFTQFQTRFSKRYGTTEELIKRATIFSENLKLVNKLNSENNESPVYSHLTPFMDMSVEEFRGRYLMQKKTVPLTKQQLIDTKPIDASALPDSFDWRDKPVVTPVKDQTNCGSCWAFSAVQAIEGAWALAGKGLIPLAPEQLVECDNYDCGCLGGWPFRAYDWLLNNTKGGIASEKEYPYCIPPLGNCYPCVLNPSYCGNTDYCNTTCNTRAQSVAFIKGYENVTNTNEDYIAQYLMEHGPLSIALNAVWMQFYHSGVSDPMYCPPDELDHAVLLVGFGTKTSILGHKYKYWIIKNSWGPKWGMDGYYLLAYGTGKCGVNRQVVFPTVVV